MIHAIAIKIHDEAIDLLQMIRLNYATECEETAGRGVKFNIDHKCVYSSTDRDAFGEYSAWSYMNGYDYRQRYSIRDFWPICAYKGYVYGFQDADRVSKRMLDEHIAAIERLSDKKEFIEKVIKSHNDAMRWASSNMTFLELYYMVQLMCNTYKEICKKLSAERIVFDATCLGIFGLAMLNALGYIEEPS